MKKYPFDLVIADSPSKFHKIKKEDFLPTGQYKIVDQGKEFIAGYTNDKALVNTLSSPIIIFGDHTKIFKYVDFPLALGADGAKALTIKNNMADCKYLYYYFKTLNLTDAGYSRHFKFLKEVSIPLPETLNDQIRIATVLTRAEKLIAKRKESIKALDEFLKSTFLEMFGDPVRNEKWWEKKCIDEIADTRVGKMRDKQFITGNHLKYYLGNSNVRWFSFDFNSMEQMDFNQDEQVKFSLQYGDLLICEGGDIGRCAIWKCEKDDIYFQKALHRVRADLNKITHVYLQYVLYCYSTSGGFKNVTNKATIAHLTGEKLKETCIPIPPLPLQTQFATIVLKVESLKAKQTQSLTELENLYASLSQRAFKGELDLSKIMVEE